jgi:hypothetical protein
VNDRYLADCCLGSRVTALPPNVRGRHMLLVARRHSIGQKSDVDIGLSNEEGLHDLCLWRYALGILRGGLACRGNPL